MTAFGGPLRDCLDSVLDPIAIGKVGLQLMRNEMSIRCTKTSESEEKSETMAGRRPLC
jgi:hypothetical protein